MERGTNHLALREVLRIQQYHCQGMCWKPPSGCVDLQISTNQLKPSPSCQSFQPDTFVCFSFPTASVPSAFSLGDLARRRGGGGGGSLHCLPREKLLENGVHVVADVLWDGNNGCWWEVRGEKEESLPELPFLSTPTIIKALGIGCKIDLLVQNTVLLTVIMNCGYIH